MFRPTTRKEIKPLVTMAEGTKVFKPLEIAALGQILDDYFNDDVEEGHRAVTVEKDNDPIGFAYFGPTPMTEGTWHLFWIFVEKGTQARGLGAKILKYVEDEIRAAGGRLLIVETSSLPHYEPTQRFYLKHGYNEVARVADFYADGDSMVVFSKRLGTE
jgi:GNAT superfamily N-acetyltransferase